MTERPSYKQTFFDRHGPEGAIRIKAIGYAFMVFGLIMGVASLQGVPMMYTLVPAATLSVLVFFGALRITRAAGDAFTYFTAGGSSTPYEEQYSQEQALVMQRDYAGALALYEHRIASAPKDARVRIAAAELYMTHGNDPRRAAELLREVQRSPAVTTGHDVYVSNKLADLYLGPLQEPRRALVEFRRLIERYPGSTAAKHARLALANLKEDMIRDHTSS
ncbi:MAG TPA: tetratricopeptide repeat protein [Gemmatimonadaceae bacterium]|nr:tetratricopeptide repeat protein [Gemmatimonadaceae bacterium]